jgi:hypothetical protein
MTRRQFGGSPADFVATVDGSGFLHAAQLQVVTFWTARTGGTQITDLQDLSSNPISTVTTDLNGLLPPFQGPASGADTMWADGGGTRTIIAATDLGAEFTAAIALLATIADAVHSGKALDLSAVLNNATGAGTGIGDKLALYGTSFGLGIQSGRIVAFCGTGNNGFAVRPDDTTGGHSHSQGADAIALLANGHIIASGSVPTAAAGSNAGTTPPAPVISGDDTSGAVTFGTGTTPAAGNMVVVTFGSPFSAAPIVTLTPRNAATAALNDYVTSVGTGAFTIAFASAPAASQANTVYSMGYQVIG